MVKEDVVILLGYSTCSYEPLNGTAIWTAKIEEDKVSGWRIYKDNEKNRQKFDIPKLI